MGVSRGHPVQEGSSFCLSDIILVWILAKAGKMVFIHLESCPVSAWAERLLSKEAAITPKITVKSTPQFAKALREKVIWCDKSKKLAHFTK